MNKKENVITRKLRELKVPQVRTYTRYETGSVEMFNYAESPKETITEGDWLRRAKGTVQANSHDTFLSRFVQLYGMTTRV